MSASPYVHKWFYRRAVKEMSVYENSIPIWRKYSLSIQEAAEYYGIGEKRLRNLIKDNPDADFFMEMGAHVRIKRELFEDYLDKITLV